MPNEVIQAISSVGFPIVACVAMYQLSTNILAKLQGTIEQNTLVIKELIVKFEKEEK